MSQPDRRTVVCGLLVALVAPASLAACGSDTPAGSSGSGGGAPTGPGGSGATTGATTGGATGGGTADGSALAKLSDVPVGGGALVDGPSGKVLLVRTSETEVKGYNPACPHQGVIVKAPENGTIACPAHGSQFDAASGSLKKGPAKTGLSTVAVKISGDSIVAA